MPRLSFRVAPEPSRLLRARERIRDYLRAHCEDDRLMDEVVLCVEEACTNTIRHSGAGDDMHISVRFEDRDLRIEVRDHGHGFDVASFDPDVIPDPLSTGGRGLYLIAHLMDELDLRANGGLEVRMLKRSALRSEARGPAVDAALGDGREQVDARMRARLEEIDEAFIAVDWEYRLAHVNQAASRLAGRPLAGLLLWEAFPGEETPLGRACRDAMELGRPAVLEFRRQPEDRWLEARLYPTSAGISLYLRDIDDRKRRELERDDYLAALGENEARYRALAVSLRERTDELTERVRLAESLEAVDGLVHSARGIDAVMERALREGTQAMGAHAGTVEMREGGTWFIRYQCGLAAETLGMRLSDDEAPMVTRAAATGEVVAVTDVGADPDMDVGFVREYDVKAGIAVPLIARGETIGCLVFHWPTPHVFGQAQLDFVRKLGSSVSLALENARLSTREEASRLGASLSGGMLARFVARSHARRWRVLLAACVTEAAFLAAIGQVPEGRQVLGIPGSLMALTVVITGVLAGAFAGVAAAVVGAAIFWIAVADLGYHSSLPATLVSTAIWITAALLAGWLADALRVQAERRQSASVALARAVAARDAQLAEQRRVEALAADLHAEREQLRTIIEQADNPIVLLDRDFNFVTVNSRYASAWGYQPDEMVGLNHFALYPNAENEAIFREVRETGEAAEIAARPFEFPDQPERGVTYWDWRVAPTKDGEGHVDGMVFSLIEVTEHVRAQRLGEALNAINVATAAGFEPETIVGTALQLTGEALDCSAGALVVRSDGQWVAAHVWNLPEELGGGVLEPAELTCAEKALASHAPVLDCELSSAEPPVFSRRRLHLACAIPLTLGRGVAGAMVFSGEKGLRRRGEAELDFAAKAGAAVSQALENARLFDEQRRLATTLQENLIHPLPGIPGMEFGRVSRAAHEPELVGGDFSDVFAVDETRVAVLIGDVAGKGVRAAGLTETVHTAVTSFALVEPSPAYVLRKTNELLLGRREDEQIVTVFLAILDRRTGEAAYSSAGHPAPVLIGEGSCRALAVPPGVPLGSFPHEYALGRTVLDAGDCLVLYTDGVIEARRGRELFGQQRLLETLWPLHGRPAQEVAERLRDEASAFAGRLRDDLQVLTVRLTGPLFDQPLRLDEQASLDLEDEVPAPVEA